MCLLSLTDINKSYNKEKTNASSKVPSKIDIWINICSSVMHSHLQLCRMIYYVPE